MKHLFAMVFVTLISYSAGSAADSFVCFGDKPPSVDLLGYNETTDLFSLDYQFDSAPSCKAIEAWESGLKATRFAFAGASFYAACTGVGAPATLWLAGGALVIQGVELTVGMLPCDNSADEAKIKKLAEEAVCKELAKQDIPCELEP